MPPVKLSTPKLYAEHEPEVHRTTGAHSTVTEVELPGFLVVGVEINGVKVPLQRLKAGKFLSRLDAVNGSKGKSGATSTGG